MEITFEVSAKAARLIGRENIADVDGALSELIKNAYDADATSVFVFFNLPFPDIPTWLSLESISGILSECDYKEILSFYLQDGSRFKRRADLSESERMRLQSILFSYNRIVVADNGDGMDIETVKSSWMQIATSSKEKNVHSRKGRVKTGAKGIGRFALDKLASKTVMYTKTAKESTLIWSLDWDQFASKELLRDVHAEIQKADQSLIDVLKKEIGERNFSEIKDDDWSKGTVLVLSPTREAWTPRLFSKVNTNLKSINPLGSVDRFDVHVVNEFYPEYSYHTESVAIDKRDYDYKIYVEYDGDNSLDVEIERNEFDDKKQFAVFEVGTKSDRFDLSDFWRREKFSKAPYRKEDYCNGKDSQHLDVDKILKVQDFDKVQAVGPFAAELYFVKNGKSDFAFVKDIPVRHRKEMLQNFSGVKLYRDNFKVRPYGDEGSLYDWLDLNDRANRSPASISHPSGAWRVLPYQLIGVVRISRLANTALYDMANREGLAQNESYYYFVQMLQEGISRFEYDRQYIYREYDAWKRECLKLIAPAAERVKEDILRHGIGNHNENEKEEEGKAQNKGIDGSASFSEVDYRETVDSLLKELDYDIGSKQLLEIMSSSGVILNTFFHEFNGVSTALHTRNHQLRARIEHLLGGQPYKGVPYLDPISKLEDYNRIDQMLSNWLKVVMDSIHHENREKCVLSLGEEVRAIVEIWGQLLSEKSIRISIEISPESEAAAYAVRCSKADLYVIINNFVLNSVYFFEEEDQESREIHIELHEDAHAIRLIMHNNGPVLNQKYIDHPMRIFELGESSKKDGTGLGLWLMRDAAERNDAQIGIVDTEEGFGISVEWKR